MKKLPVFAFLLLTLTARCQNKREASVQEGYDVHVGLQQKNLSTNKKIELMKKAMELNNKYPGSIPVSEDSMGRIFLPNPPEKLAFLTLLGTTVFPDKDGGLTARLSYRNVPPIEGHMNLDSIDEDKFLFFDVLITDHADIFKWRRSAKWAYDLELTTKTPTKDKLVVKDSKGRQWIKVIPDPLNEQDLSGLYYYTWYKNRYEIRLQTMINDKSLPEFRKYETEIIAEPDFFYKVIDMNYLSKLPN